MVDHNQINKRTKNPREKKNYVQSAKWTASRRKTKPRNEWKEIRKEKKEKEKTFPPAMRETTRLVSNAAQRFSV